MKKVAVLVLALGTFRLCAAESPKDIAVRIIRSETSPAYNPLDNSERELNLAAVINSRLRLNHLMAGDTVSEELRVCYALKVIDERLRKTQPEAKEQLLKDQELLAKHLRGLQRSVR